MDSTTHKLSTAETARVLGVPELRVRELARRLLGRPSGQGHRYAFDFRDLVVLRTAAQLLERQVPAPRVVRALAALGERLPEGVPLSGLRIYAAGTRVAVREGGRSWDPETGQILLDLDFDVRELARRATEVVDVRRERGSPRRSAAQIEFEHALELEESNLSAACEAYGRALELDPDFVDAYINLGRLAHEARRLLEAIQLYQEALDRRPEDPVIHFNLALAIEDHSGPERAIPHYERALAIDPGFADAHFNLASLFERVGRPQDAIRHYRTYRRLTQPAG
jgi:tetratricopeptide (TPR) repeat protein